MDSQRIQSVVSALREYGTEELLGIWIEDDREEWAPEAFEAVRLILVERGEPLPVSGSACRRARRPTGRLARVGSDAAQVLRQIEWRRRWPAGTLGRQAASVLAIAGLEILFLWAFDQPWFAVPWPGGRALSTLRYILFRGCQEDCFTGAGMMRVQDYARVVVTAAAGAAACFFMPASAALSVAPDRESGRLEGLAITGLRASAVLFAKAVAHVGPFVLLSCCAWLIATLIAWQTHAAGSHANYNPLCVLMSAGVLVSISALCRRVYTSLALCYLAQMAFISAGLFIPDVLAGVVLPFVLCVVLVPLALRSLRYPRG